jgi:hypothetical protein
MHVAQAAMSAVVSHARDLRPIPRLRLDFRRGARG